MTMMTTVVMVMVIRLFDDAGQVDNNDNDVGQVAMTMIRLFDDAGRVDYDDDDDDGDAGRVDDS